MIDGGTTVYIDPEIERREMIPRLRGMVVTTIQEGAETGAYVNVTFVVPHSEAPTIDLGQAFEDLATLMREDKIKERRVADRREFIQPV